MSQHTMFGEAEMVTFMEVRKADGRLFHYRVDPDGATVLITQAEYEEGTV